MQDKKRKTSEPIPKPHFGPENQAAQQAVDLGENLLRFSEQIAEQCQQSPELPQLNQLIFERDKALGTLTAIKLNALPDKAQEWLLFCLRQCQSIDQTNLETMQAFKTTMSSQLQGMKDAGVLMDKYRAGSKQESTRWEEA